MNRQQGQQLRKAPMGAVARPEKVEYHYFNKDLDKWVSIYLLLLLN